MNTKPYWLRLEFPPQAVEIVKAALRTKLWQGTDQERLEKLRALNAQLSAHYGTSVCAVELQATPIGPHYRPGKDLIVLDKPSLVSYLHELAHHVLHSRRLPQNETYPRSFSLGLFYKAAPRLFETARQGGRLLFTDEGGQHAE